MRELADYSSNAEARATAEDAVQAGATAPPATADRATSAPADGKVDAPG